MQHDRTRNSNSLPAKLPVALAAVGAGLVTGGMLGADRLIATTAKSEAIGGAVLYEAVDIMDYATGKDISNFLLGAVLITMALATNVWKRQGILGGPLLYVGLVQLLTTTFADLSKPLFGRLRPFQAIDGGMWNDRWFAGTDFGSFPSGHVAFYCGLIIPLALLDRRLAALLFFPAVVALQRVVAHDHYMTDVGASLLLAVLCATALWRVSSRSRAQSAG